MMGAATSRPRSTHGIASFVRRTGIPFFTTQMGKGTVPGGTNLYMGTAALSERDYVHDAIDAADLIVAIGHDPIEKPPFIMGPAGPKVIHVSYTSASVEQVYFPDAEVVGEHAGPIEGDLGGEHRRWRSASDVIMRRFAAIRGAGRRASFGVAPKFTTSHDGPCASESRSACARRSPLP